MDVERPTAVQERGGWAALALLLVLHLGATCVLLSPRQLTRAEPLLHIDYPVHTHRVFVYRQALLASGLPWGYDPAVGGGLVMTPEEDVGAKPQQVLGLLLLPVAPGAVVKLFLFFAVLGFPVWTLLACRRLGLGTEVQFWTLAALLAGLWFSWTLRLPMEWGLISFVSAAAVAPWTLALFLAFIATPRARTYIPFVGAATLLTLLHVQGPWAVAPVLAILTLVSPLPGRWRAAALLAPGPILALNGFWVIPLLLARRMPEPPGIALPLPGSFKHLTYGSWTELLDGIDAEWVLARGVVVGLAVCGTLALGRMAGRRVGIAYALAAATALGLGLLGSFVPWISRFQPVRFTVPGIVLLALPLGSGLAALRRRSRLPAAPCAYAVLLAALVVGVWSEERGPRRLPLPPSPDPLTEFVADRTTPGERLAIQSHDGYRTEGYEARVLPLILDREVIGCTFPDTHDPAQFLRHLLLGRELASWTPGELRAALERWGISWVFTVTPEASELLAATTGSPGSEIGRYRAYRVAPAADRFLVGEGRLEAGVNRLELAGLVADNGLVVLRYRFHPAWKAEPPLQIRPYAVPEDPRGFIALEDPPEELTLHFGPWSLLRSPWP